MDVADKYKGNYRMDFIDRHGKKTECRIRYIPVSLCEFPNKDLILVAVYGFWAQPMLLLTNLDISEKKKLCLIAAKIYFLCIRIRSDIKGFLLKKEQSQQVTLSQYFGIGAFE